MPETVWSPSPEAIFDTNVGADIGFGIDETGVIRILDNADFDIGTVSKGVQTGVAFVLFEINEPVGTVFTSVEFSLYNNFVAGALSNDFWFGILAKDGTWNVNPEVSPNGLGDYTLKEDFPKPLSGVDAAWASGAASISGTLDFAVQPVGGTPNRVTWGSTGLGSDFEDAQFLTDFQAAFDANETDRTVARGVPVLLYIRPVINRLGIFRFVSQNDPTEADHPTLTLNVSDVVDPGTIYTVVAKPTQINVTTGVAQASVTAKSGRISVTAKPFQASVTAKVDAIDVVEKPDTIDVTGA